MPRRSPEAGRPQVKTVEHAHEAPARAVDSLSRMFTEALHGESFEGASDALAELERRLEIRNQIYGLKFSRFYRLFEDMDTVRTAPGLSSAEREQEMETVYDLAEDRAQLFTPRIADLYHAIIGELRGQPYSPKFETTSDKMKSLIDDGDLAVCAGDYDWSIKLNRFSKRFEGVLANFRALDKRTGHTMTDEEKRERKRQRQEKLDNDSDIAPSRQDSSTPSMDEMERLEKGEKAKAHWSIRPPFGGRYFSEQAFSVWNEREKQWTESNYTYTPVIFVPELTKEEEKPGTQYMNFTMTARVQAGAWTTIPSPYSHSISKIDSGSKEYTLRQDQNGDVCIMVKGEGIASINITQSPNADKIHGPVNVKNVPVPEMPASLTEETRSELDRIQKTEKGNFTKAKAIMRYVRNSCTYSNDSSFNAIYKNRSRDYTGAVDEHKMADCDVANTYFAGLCAQLSIPVRHRVGHTVKGKNKATGASQIDSGTGHAWSEIWDDGVSRWIPMTRWERMDATPAGDPNLDPDDQDGESSDAIPGDYGEQEVQRFTDEYLEELRKKLAEHKEKLGYTPEERYLAKHGGVELAEARQIVKEIHEADKTKLPNGKLITDVLEELFNTIVETRRNTDIQYTGPVRKQDGGRRISHIVRHKIGVEANVDDPVSRERAEDHVEEEQSIGGFDVYIIGDKSGSMSGSIGSETLWQMQRRAEYLIFSALHRFSTALQHAGISEPQSLAVNSMGISFRGGGEHDIDLDKGFSGAFTEVDKVKMWHSITNQGGGNGDTQALKYIHDQIAEQIEKEEKSGDIKKRIRIVIACSDGGPDSTEGVHAWAEALGKQGAIVVGIGLTESATVVPIIYTTAFSRGDIAKDINDLPIIVAKHVIMEAVRLFPEHARADVEHIINRILADFS